MPAKALKDFLLSDIQRGKEYALRAEVAGWVTEETREKWSAAVAGAAFGITK